MCRLTVVVFVVSSDEMVKGLQAAVALWDQLLPPQPHQGEGKWVPHPLGERKAFLFASMVEQIVAHVPCFQEAAMKDVMTYLANLDVASVLKLNIGSFGPRYPTPKAGRPWVWELSSVAQADFRQAIFAMMTCLQQTKVDALKIEPMRRGPVGLRQSLWDDLRKVAPNAQ